MACVDAKFDIGIFDTSEFDTICKLSTLFPTQIDTTTSDIYSSIPSTLEVYKSTISSIGIQKGTITPSEVHKSTLTTSSDKKSKISIRE